MNSSLNPYDRTCPNCCNDGKCEPLGCQEKENTHGRYFRVICLYCGAKSKWKKI